jgi:ubiquinone/menaquinone biosynthesis C-methylase UbiE
MVTKAKAFYDEEVLNFDKHMKITKHYDAQKRLYSRFKPFLKAPILDLACGPGFLVSLLLKNKFEIYANDISKKMLEYAKSKYVAKYTNINAENINLKNINSIICCNLFYYLNQQKAIKNWFVTLPKNGILIIMEEYPFIITNKKTIFGKREEDLKQIMKYMTPQEICFLAEKIGFKFLKKYKTKIDLKHSLYCQIFIKN